MEFLIIEKKKGQSKTDNPEKLATQGTQDEEIHHKNTTQYVLGSTMRKRTQKHTSRQ